MAATRNDAGERPEPQAVGPSAEVLAALGMSAEELAALDLPAEDLAALEKLAEEQADPQKQAFDQAAFELAVFGFTILEGVLSDDEADGYRDALIECNARAGGEQRFLGQAGHVTNLPTLDRRFHALIDHPAVLPVVESVLGGDIILGSLDARIVRPGDPEQGFHSDIGQPMLNLLSPVMANTVWMLDDFTIANGCTRIVPGSHRSNIAWPPSSRHIPHVFRAEAPKGSVLVFNGQCWHAGGRNDTHRDRHGVFGHYRKSMLMFQVDPHDGFPPEWLDGLTDRQRQLMRMTHGVDVPHAADVHINPPQP